MSHRDHQKWTESEESILARGFTSGIPIQVLAKRHLRSISLLQEKLEELGWLQPVRGMDSSAGIPDAYLNEHEPGSQITAQELAEFYEGLDYQSQLAAQLETEDESLEIPFDRDLDSGGYVGTSDPRIHAEDWADSKDDFDSSEWEDYMAGPDRENDDHYDEE